MKKHLLRLVAQGVVIAVAIGLGPASLAAEAASPVYLVDDDGAQCPTAQYTNATDPAGPLQAAINDAIANGVKTISVCKGTYQAISISNAGTLTVKAFDVAARPEIVAPPTNSWDYVISVVNSTTIVLDGLLVTRTLTGDAAGGSMSGIVYFESGGTVQNTIIRDMVDPAPSAGMSGSAISISNSNPGGPTSVKVTAQNNLIDGYAGTGISLGGRGSFTVSGNVIRGSGVGACGGTMPCYGITVYGYTGATKGKIAQNVISQTLYGMWLSEVGGLSITGNVISDIGNIGLTIEDHCYANTLGSSKNKISGNSFFRNTGRAIDLLASEADPGSICGPRIDQTLISKNNFTATQLTQFAPISLFVTQAGTPYTASITRTQITSNQLWGFQMIASETGSTGTQFKSNKVIGP